MYPRLVPAFDLLSSHIPSYPECWDVKASLGLFNIFMSNLFMSFVRTISRFFSPQLCFSHFQFSIICLQYTIDFCIFILYAFLLKLVIFSLMAFLQTSLNSLLDQIGQNLQNRNYAEQEQLKLNMDIHCPFCDLITQAPGLPPLT